MELSPWSHANGMIEPRLGGDATGECDRCGRTVRRQTAVEQDDGTGILLCPECEFGVD